MRHHHRQDLLWSMHAAEGEGLVAGHVKSNNSSIIIQFHWKYKSGKSDNIPSGMGKKGFELKLGNLQ